eukprot:CAMPEP_0172318042 /NCGR_PEP_ID=MMETSP1058-20130122/33718_1 /TAXON_ID=83371 /ORGANISM="Detonula confervacea, Strain CCMP 353" /LENGTH=440 /DNA_ID=CAMNT_0013032765 /DNA_START=59 /DNA_END=1381 /DNA_ORIENTATION=+
MGLRPSVNKNEGNNSNSSVGDLNKNSPSSMSPTNDDDDENESTFHEGNHGSSSGSSISSSASTSPQPQREAWTVRGQLLLNFHHAISRAINSPEMSAKCTRIAADMSRNEEMTSQQQQSPRAPTTTTAAANHSMAEQYSAEAALIVENKSKRDATVRNKSIALGLFSFVTLRSGRGLSAWVRKSIAANRSYQFDHVKSSTTPAATAANIALKQQPSNLRKFLRVTLDATIATSITLLSGTFLFMPRPSSYIEDMSKLPLVEGKSVYAEMVCPPLMKEYRRVLEEYGGRWPVMGTAAETTATTTTRTFTASDEKVQQGDVGAMPQLTQEDVSLNVIRTFVENCSKRSKYERALLEERNALSSLNNNNQQQSTVSRMMRRIDNSKKSSMGDSLREEMIGNSKLGTVSIPSPGVPEDISVNLDQEVFSLATDDVKEEAEDVKK